MAKAPTLWKKGRGALGPLDPLLGRWHASAESPMGPMSCTREFSRLGSKGHIQLVADWAHSKFNYREVAIYSSGDDQKLRFWSFTSDGKRSEGALADATDIHPEAVGFEAQMPAGLARMAYWPDADVGFHFVVEARNKSGWKRFLSHHYKPAPASK
jgi:hypothetical protein